MESGVGAEQRQQVRELVRHATQRLLGDTIAVSDEDWRGPSRLPGWSRGHVATHIARQAEGICRLAEWARTGERQDMYASNEARDDDIEAGSGRPGLELQIDLDTTAGRLEQAWDELDDQGWQATVEMRGGAQVPARLLPLARLLEVVVHHVDLDIGYDIDDIDDTTAEWLLEWYAYRRATRAQFPPTRLVADSGFTIDLGPDSDDRTVVSGGSAQLLGWALNRSDTSAVHGAEGVQRPTF